MNRFLKMISLYSVFALLLLLAGGLKGENTNNPGATQITPLEQVIQNAEEAKYDDLRTIYDLDVFGYFSLHVQYNTELKKAAFKKTQEYVNELNELKNMKQNVLRKRYYVTLPGDYIRDYNLNLKGFEIFLGLNFGQGTIEARAPKSVNGFYFPMLLTTSRPLPQEFGGPELGEECIFIPMGEEQALKIENERKNTVIYIIFRIAGMETVAFRYRCLTYGWYDIKQKVFTVSSFRLVIGNKVTGEVYFDKLYATQKK